MSRWLALLSALLALPAQGEPASPTLSGDRIVTLRNVEPSPVTVRFDWRLGQTWLPIWLAPIYVDGAATVRTMLPTPILPTALRGVACWPGTAVCSEPSAALEVP